MDDNDNDDDDDGDNKEHLLPLCCAGHSCSHIAASWHRQDDTFSACNKIMTIKMIDNACNKVIVMIICEGIYVYDNLKHLIEWTDTGAFNAS